MHKALKKAGCFLLGLSLMAPLAQSQEKLPDPSVPGKPATPVALPVAGPSVSPAGINPNPALADNLPFVASSGESGCMDGCMTGCKECGPPGRFWIEGEVLLWWVQGAHLPPVISGSPAGTTIDNAGILGTPGATTLFGDNYYNGNLRVGGRITSGMWLNEDQTLGLEFYAFLLPGVSSGLTAGTPAIIGRPFTDPNYGSSVENVSYPNLVNGFTQAGISSGPLFGAGVLARGNLYCGSNYRLDALAGYRYLSISDSVKISENLTSTDPIQSSLLLGTNFSILDSFRTSNQFNGGDVGLAGEYRFGNWFVDGRARIALGCTHQTCDIFGVTTVTIPGNPPPVTYVGGLLAQSSNIGNYSRDVISYVPELGGHLGYQLTQHVRLKAGYTFLYWSNVVRAGNQIDTVVNTNLIPGQGQILGSTPARPAFQFNSTGLWAQGIDLGVEFRF